MRPTVERRLGRIRSCLLRGEGAAKAERTHQMRSNCLDQFELPLAAVGVILMVGERQGHHAVRTSLDDHAGRVVTEPSRFDVFVVMLGLFELLVGDHGF